jgi:voltage-gated sodium channel
MAETREARERMIPAQEGTGLRDRVRGWIESPRVQTGITALIVLNAITLGLETSATAMAAAGPLLHAIPGMGSVVMLLAVLYYVFSVMATKLFADRFPEWFGTIGSSFYTLFQIMTLESWSMGIVRPVMEVHPLAWLFFVPFILLTSFAVLNLFIGIIVDAMQSQAHAEEEALHRGEPTLIDVMAEVRALRADMAALRGDGATLRGDEVGDGRMPDAAPAAGNGPGERSVLASPGDSG